MAPELVEHPSIGEQYEDIVTYTVNLCYKFAEKQDDFITMPKCEKGKGPAKIAYWEDPTPIMPSSKPHYDYRGIEDKNSRVCPYCNAIVWSNAAIGQIVGCLHCGGSFLWAS